MKYCLLTAMALWMLMFFGCTKSATNEGAISASLTGKWNYTEYFYSTGAPGEWHPANEANKWIEFRDDGSFASNLSPLNTAIKFHIVDSTHVQFNTVLTTDSSLYYFFAIDTEKKELQLSPARVVCIEGCAQKFSK